jgi:multidrug efflux pump subunit AcrA (membrane-fusion protein)/YHS domain-containing protein
MRPRSLLFVILLALPLAFLAGRLSDPGEHASASRKILYYVDPMNPSFRSPEPGIAPCGMPFEPVYAEGAAPAAGGMAPGGVTVTGDRQQLIGVAKEKVGRRTVRHTLRLVGTVVPDETRLYRVTAAAAGQIREIGGATTGSFVPRGEMLGAFYTPDGAIPQQNYLKLHLAYQAGQKPGGSIKGALPANQSATYDRNHLLARQNLLNLGMSPEQIEAIGTTGLPDNLIELKAPAAGIILTRNISLGQSFEPGDELYTIAALDRVWILADAFEGQEELLTTGKKAVISSPGLSRTRTAEVSSTIPRFDPESRTLKVRLEAANPGYLLRPGMFVDVSLPVDSGPALFVQREAILDTGTRTLVFVEEKPGIFVPRPVRTGRRAGNLVEVRFGLMEGEVVVTAGNFLLDSESRMRAAGAALDRGGPVDPVCGMETNESKAAAAGLVSEQGGKRWYFCTPDCKRAFDADPAAAVARSLGETAAERAVTPTRGTAGGDATPGGGPDPGTSGMDTMDDREGMPGMAPGAHPLTAR